MSEQYSSPDTLAERLDRALPAGRNTLPPHTSDPLVNTAAAVARAKLPTLSPAASTRIEGRMMAVFNEQYHLQASAQRRQGFVGAARWALVASVILVLLVASMTPVVAASVPGEPLYPVKQFYERVELAAAAAASPTAQATVHVWRAERRTQESLILLTRNQFEPTLIDAALAEIDAAATTATAVRASPLLRAQLLQVKTLMGFVLENAEQDGLTSPAEITERTEKVKALGESELLLPLPVEPGSGAPAADTAEATQAVTPTQNQLTLRQYRRSPQPVSAVSPASRRDRPPKLPQLQPANREYPASHQNRRPKLCRLQPASAEAPASRRDRPPKLP